MNSDTAGTILRTLRYHHVQDMTDEQLDSWLCLCRILQPLAVSDESRDIWSSRLYHAEMESRRRI